MIDLGHLAECFKNMVANYIRKTEEDRTLSLKIDSSLFYFLSRQNMDAVPWMYSRVGRVLHCSSGPTIC